MELNAQSIAFVVFSIITIGGAIGVAATHNLVRGSYWLMVSLFGVAGIFVLLSAPFLAAVQILVYIGAVGILITFAVMLTRSMTNMRELFNQQWWLSAAASALLLLMLVIGVLLPVWGPGGTLAGNPVSDQVATTVDLGRALVDGNQYVIPFEVISLLLTAAMIGAIVIAREQHD